VVRSLACCLAIAIQTAGGATRAADAAGDPKALAAEVERLDQAGRWAEAIPLAIRVLEVEEAAQPPRDADVAAAVHDLAELYWATGQYGRAEPLYERSLAIREKALGPEHPDVAESLNDLGKLLHDTGAYARAEPLYERALAIREKALGPEHPDVAESLANLGMLHLARGDLERVPAFYERALAIREKALGPEHPDVAKSLNNRALYQQIRGDYAGAEPLYERSLAIWEKSLGPEHPYVAGVLNNLAMLHVARGDYARAEPLYERALAIVEKTLGPAHPDPARLLTNLAMLHVARGDPARAEPLYERSLALAEKSLGPDHPQVAWTLGGLASLYAATGRPARAEPLFERSLAIAEETLGPDHPQVALALGGLGSLYVSSGSFARAEPLYARSLEILERSLGAAHPGVADALSKLAWLYAAMGDPARAEPFQQRALAIFETSLGPQHPSVAASLDNLGRLRWAAADQTGALEYFARGAAVDERRIGLFLPGASEAQARAYLATSEFRMYEVLSFQAANPGDPAAARLGLEMVLRRKGSLLDSVAGGFAALRGTLAAEDRSLLDDLLARRAQLSRLVLRGPGGGPPDGYRAAVEELEERVEEAERAALRRGGALRGALAPVRLEEVRSRIPDDAALLELVSYRELRPNPGDGGRRWGSQRYGAYLLRREGDPAWLDLGDAEAIEARARAFREAVQRTSFSPRSGETFPWWAGLPEAQPARAMHEIFLAPFGSRLEGVRSLLVAPDGVLNLVPFGAAVDPDGRYLVERYTITYLTSGRDLLRFGETRASPARPMVLAAPDYAALGAAPREASASGEASISRRSRDFRRREWPPLPGARLEGEAVAKLLGVKALSSREARESTLKQLQGPSLLHVATHAFFLPDVPESIEDGEEAPPSPTPSASPLGRFSAPPGENPLLRSGLVLAGADGLAEGEEDGILTALEAAGLDLSGTQLVVLSACDTGVGEVAIGEGVYGLRRAISIAGAQAQLSSLWRVSDEGTRWLMEAYYRRLLAGEGRSEALRQVQLEMLRHPVYRAPFYWAAFVPIGDWRPVDLAAPAQRASRNPASCSTRAGLPKTRPSLPPGPASVMQRPPASGTSSCVGAASQGLSIRSTIAPTPPPTTCAWPKASV
jgi:CHAT domain-containing protein/tetratricopeptide (TPR) repeat protein